MYNFQRTMNNEPLVPQDMVEQGPTFPVSTLVQRVGQRAFRQSYRYIMGERILLIEFPRGLTVLMGAHNPNRPFSNGFAEILVHRKFLIHAARYLHWIRLNFHREGTSTQAQILLQGRLQTAIAMIRRGACACFLQSPVRSLRREANTRRRSLQANRI